MDTKRKSIPDAIKRELRQEVGFGCPVKGCGNPYLEYHHFDPPVHIQAHNEVKGMIALCPEHHRKADGGSYTVEQLHSMKQDVDNATLVRGRLDWLRRDMLAVVGGNFYYETPKIIVIDGHDVVALERDSDGYLRLSIELLSILDEERIVMQANSWENIGAPSDLRSPPQGKELEVHYSNGDMLHIRFIEINTVEEACSRYKTDIFLRNSLISFPLTVVEVALEIGGTNIKISPDATTLGGAVIKGCLTTNCGAGISADFGFHWRHSPKWKLASRVTSVDGGNVINVKFGRK
ncbi:hypothetical protein [Deefgea rivuli]|uniref:hypothetical protein n=1 Tax=Deefgea rivuli TaxID=400948 RepID=UPI00055F79EB|nr:hypothetical protein [Deefgea rivuli]